MSYLSIRFTEEETACYESRGPDGDKFRADVRNDALTRARWEGKSHIEVRSHDGDTFAAWRTDDE